MRWWILLPLLYVVLPVAAAEREDIVLADFEGDDYGEWKTTGDAFGKGPAKGTLPGQMPVTGFLGKGLVNSFTGGDKTTGTLTSPEFTIDRKYVTFLIGGGHHPGKACINLLVEGKAVRTATGPNKQPGGTERLDPHSWDVSDLAGKKARIEIVDQVTGGWGHINIDHIVLTDKKPPAVLTDAQREFTVSKPYLNFPVKTGDRKRRMTLLVDGKPFREFEVELAEREPDFWVPVDLASAQGKKLTVRVDKVREDEAGWKAIDQGDSFPGGDVAYREKSRPQFHFTSRRGWLNDPNGLVYSAGEYHLFYQHNPYGWDWGNMHWGHAVSKDLVHWEELPEALYPPRFGDWCFSGSAVVDRDNTSGWKKGKEDVIVAAFTSTGRGECVVYSNDRGRTWQEYEGNPVVKHAGRDPKLVWHTPTKQWVMAVYDEHEGKRWIAFHTSPDLKKWTFQSRIEGFYECPDLFELPVDGDAKKSKWVLYAADGKYVLGSFDGKEFKPDPGKHTLWHGNFYAAQTYSDAPDGRRIQIGWAQGAAFPGVPFNQQMTVPCELSLRTTDEGVRMFAVPVKELDTLHGKGRDWKDLTVKPGDNPLADMKGELFDIRAEFQVGAAEQVGLTVRGVPVVYDVKKQELSCRGKAAPVKAAGGTIRLHILVDRGSVEVFANDGRVAISAGGVFSAEERSLAAFAKGGEARIKALTVYEMKSAWEGGR